MSEILYTNVNIIIDERCKDIIINPVSERFYFIEYDDTQKVFYDATLALNENGAYVIEGRQTIYSVRGFHKREVQSKYICKYKEYCISERKNIISSEFENSNSELNSA